MVKGNLETYIFIDLFKNYKPGIGLSVRDTKILQYSSRNTQRDHGAGKQQDLNANLFPSAFFLCTVPLSGEKLVP